MFYVIEFVVSTQAISVKKAIIELCFYYRVLAFAATNKWL
jgi:hypothetical protein